jgi:hypothetical protein
MRKAVKPPVRTTPPPDLGLPASQAAQLDLRLRQLQTRWKPHTDSPDALLTDLYELLEWVVDGGDPTCPILVVQRGTGGE